MQPSEGYYRALFSATVTLTLAILGRSVDRASVQVYLLPTASQAGLVHKPPLYLQLFAACALCLLQDWCIAWTSGDAGGGRL